MATKTDKPRSVLIGFGKCPLCKGKSHIKRIPTEGKRPYSHCLDEFDKGCSHTHYATTAGQEALMLASMRPINTDPPPADPPAADPAPAPTPEPAAAPAPAIPPAAPAKRRGLFA